MHQIVVAHNVYSLFIRPTSLPSVQIDQQTWKMPIEEGKHYQH